MSTNKEIVSNFFRVMDSGDWAAVRELMHPEHSFHWPSAPEPMSRDGHLELTENFRKSFTELEHVIEQQLEDGDKVVLRGHVRMRHTGEFNGIPATGNLLEIGFMDIVRLEDGKNREEWALLDVMGLMAGIGAMG